MNNKLKITFNYGYILFLLLAVLSISIFATGYLTVIAVCLIVLGITIAIAGTQLFYRYVSLEDNQCIFQPWLGKKEIILTHHINRISVIEEDWMVILTFEVIQGNTIKNYNLSYRAYVMGDIINLTNATVLQSVENFAKKHDVPFLNVKHKAMSHTELGNSLRFIVYPAVVIFAGMLYFDMKVLTGVHFETMHFIIPRVVIVLATCLFCYVFFKLTKNKSAFLNTLLFGTALGLLLSSVAKSYVHWYNEQHVQDITEYYPMTLDDYDSYVDQQRWIIESEEAEQLIGQKRLFLFGTKRDRIMNNQLIEEKTYLIPVAVGMFNDVFIPKDGFMDVKEHINATN